MRRLRPPEEGCGTAFGSLPCLTLVESTRRDGRALGEDRPVRVKAAGGFFVLPEVDVLNPRTIQKGCEVNEQASRR